MNLNPCFIPLDRDRDSHLFSLNNMLYRDSVDGVKFTAHRGAPSRGGSERWWIIEHAPAPLGKDGIPRSDTDGTPVLRSRFYTTSEELNAAWDAARRSWRVRWPSARYREQVEMILSGFEFELCYECGEDLNRHVISPDPLGNAHAWCMDQESQEGKEI